MDRPAIEVPRLAAAIVVLVILASGAAGKDLPRVRVLSGRIIDEEGQPVPRCMVRILPDSLLTRFELHVPDLPCLSLRALARLGPGDGMESDSVPLMPPGEDLTVVVTRKGTVLLRFIGNRQGASVVAPKVWVDGELQSGLPWRCSSVRLRATPGKHSIRVVAMGKSPRVLKQIEFDPTRERQLEVRFLAR